MAYFPDLSPYTYGGHGQGVVNVGWLDGIHQFARGDVAPELIQKMRLLAAAPVVCCLGYHHCQVCVKPDDIVLSFVRHGDVIKLNDDFNRRLADVKMIDPNCSWARWATPRKGNGEIRVANDSVIFAAPVLIVHYIEEHNYLPPPEFLKAVENTDIPNN